jgi:hypothetical protein
MEFMLNDRIATDSPARACIAIIRLEGIAAAYHGGQRPASHTAMIFSISGDAADVNRNPLKNLLFVNL